MINDKLLSYHESNNQLASLSSNLLPPLGMIGNPIVVSDDEDDNENLLSH
jgi:hypothetical protein